MADAEEGGGGGGERLDPRLEALCQYCLRTLKARQLFVGLISLMFPGLAGTHFYKSFFTRGRPGKDGLIHCSLPLQVALRLGVLSCF